MPDERSDVQRMVDEATVCHAEHYYFSRSRDGFLGSVYVGVDGALMPDPLYGGSSYLPEHAATEYLLVDRVRRMRESDPAAVLERVREIVADDEAQMQCAMLPMDILNVKCTTIDAIRDELAKLGGPDGR